MYAIVNIAGQQYKVEKDQKIFVHRLQGKEGDAMNFDEVLLIDNDKSVVVGEPVVKGARIVGKVLAHPKSDKVHVFKKKRRKGYKVKNGHRQYMTQIQIQDIIEKGAEKKPVAKTEETTAPKKETPAAKTSTAKKPASAPKKETAAKTTAKAKPAAKPAAKKTTGTKAAAKPVAKKPAAKKPAAKKLLSRLTWPTIHCRNIYSR